jgi:hypothetical protein
MVFIQHRVINIAHNRLDRIPRYTGNRHMLFRCAVRSIGSHLLHFLPAADNRHAFVLHHYNNVLAVFTFEKSGCFHLCILLHFVLNIPHDADISAKASRLLRCYHIFPKRHNSILYFHERTSLFSLTSPFIYDTMDLQKNHVANATFRRVLWKI